MIDLDSLVARIEDGSKLALAADYYSGCAMAAVRRLIARGARDLHLIGIPTLGFQADMLIGACGASRAAACRAGSAAAGSRRRAAICPRSRKNSARSLQWGASRSRRAAASARRLL